MAEYSQSRRKVRERRIPTLPLVAAARALQVASREYRGGRHEVIQ